MPAVCKEFISVIEGGQLRLQDHHALLLDTEPAASRGWGKNAGPCHECPADRPVPVLLQALVLQGPDVLAEAGVTSLAGVLEISIVVAFSLLPLRLAHPQVCLVWHFLHLRSHFHFHSCLVDDALLEALATQGALAGVSGPPRAAAVAPRPLGHHRDLAGDDLGVVAGYNAPEVGHGAVGHLDGLAVEYLPQPMPWWKAGVYQVEKLSSDVRGDGVALVKNNV